MGEYSWPDVSDDSWGKCEDCGLQHPLRAGLCKGCAKDLYHRETRDADDNLELFPDEEVNSQETNTPVGRANTSYWLPPNMRGM